MWFFWESKPGLFSALKAGVLTITLWKHSEQGLGTMNTEQHRETCSREGRQTDLTDLCCWATLDSLDSCILPNTYSQGFLEKITNSKRLEGASGKAKKAFTTTWARLSLSNTLFFHHDHILTGFSLPLIFQDMYLTHLVATIVWITPHNYFFWLMSPWSRFPPKIPVHIHLVCLTVYHCIFFIFVCIS